MTTYATEQDASDAANVESVRMDKDGSVIDFDGQNCFDIAACAGWDGNDRRCNCGNRRVGWTITQCSPGVWMYYAEAY